MDLLWNSQMYSHYVLAPRPSVDLPLPLPSLWFVVCFGAFWCVGKILCEPTKRLSVTVDSWERQLIQVP